MQPLISIIVPCYKVEKYLPKCIDSIINQSYTNLEIFLIDDGSPDSCGIICDNYSKKDSRIKVIHKSNGGLSDARNVAIDKMTGEYVVFVDSDDYIAPTHIEGLYKMIQYHKAEISINSFTTFYDGLIPHPHSKPTKEYVYTGLEATERMFYQDMFDNSAWGKMYKSSLFNNIRYPKGLLYEDLPTTYRLMLKASKVIYNNNETYYYLLRSDSIERSKFSSEKLNSALKLMELMELMEQDKQRFQPIIKSYYCRMVSFIFHIILQMPKQYKHKDLFYDKLKKYRKIVLCDKKARKKTRIACLCSYFGINIVLLLFHYVTNRGK